ncbi:MAG: gamma-glutamyl-gamma-aminobutyrate hydrolase family protein [Oscillospiraceae bacterium]
MGKIVGVVYLGSGIVRKYLQHKYTTALKRAGAEVRILQWSTKSETVEEYVQGCDGFLFPGGDDINPVLYNEKKQTWCGAVCDERDDFELRLLERSKMTGKPVLGICRGAQLINAAFGGSLFQDILHDTQKAEIEHWNVKKRAQKVHSIDIAEGSLLENITALQSKFEVNTMHHQAINRLAEGFRASAVAPDGIIEAIEKKDCRFFLAVQWHPEFLASKFEEHRRIFDAFVEAL